MKTVVRAAVAFATLLPAAPAAAQYQFPDPTVLVGPGPTIGVRVREMSSEERTNAKLETSGVYIEEVEKDTPAERAGLKSGDILTDFDGERVRSVRGLARLVSETPPRRTVKATIVRDGEPKTIEITPEASRHQIPPDFADRLPRNLPDLRQLPRQPRGLPEIPRFELLPPQRRLGVTLNAVDGQMAEYFGVSAGVLVSAVERDSAAARAGLKAGDVITAVNGRAVRRPLEVTEAVREAAPGATLRLKVVRDRKEIGIDVVLPNGAALPVPAAPVSGSDRVHV